MLIPFLRQIPLLGVLLSLLMAGNSLSQPHFAPFPNFTPSGWSGVVVAADASGRMDVPLLFQFDYPGAAFRAHQRLRHHQPGYGDSVLP